MVPKLVNFAVMPPALVSVYDAILGSSCIPPSAEAHDTRDPKIAHRSDFMGCPPNVASIRENGVPGSVFRASPEGRPERRLDARSGVTPVGGIRLHRTGRTTPCYSLETM